MGSVRVVNLGVSEKRSIKTAFILYILFFFGDRSIQFTHNAGFRGAVCGDQIGVRCSAAERQFGYRTLRPAGTLC